jgi:two-component system OmpR family sensor kinase
VTWRWLAALAPLVLGLAYKAITLGEWLENPVLFLRGDTGTLALLFGVLLSGVASAFLLQSQRAARRRQADVVAVQTQAAEDRRQFLRRLDHELKNPLTAIQVGLANVASAPSPETGRTALESVRSQALRLSRLAADLRKLADLETRPLDRTSVNMAELLQEVVDVTADRPEAAQREVALTVPQAPWPLPDVNGDPDLLFLAVHNLLSNALKFTQPGDRIEVRALEDGAAVVVEVADTGPGIPKKEIPHVWEELYRGEGARGVPGSGLGLALVRAIADRHDGQVALRSREGQGTVFTLRLPIG